MDADRFDALSRRLGALGTRRGLLRLLGAVPLVGLLTTGLADGPGVRADGGDHGSSHRRQRRKARHDPGGDKANRKGKRKGKQNDGGNDGKKGGGKDQRNSACHGPKDCGGRPCCRGKCCPANATTCNLADLCCVPNCAGRDCGPDGCGRGGTCGTCPQGAVCDEASGQCRCTATSCQNGCCAANGSCQPGTTTQFCGSGGESCATCTGQETCQNGQCTCVPTTCAALPNQCGQVSDGCGGTITCRCATGCCDVPNQVCKPGTTPPFCGTGGSTCATCTGQEQCQNGRCVACVPACRGKACGPDGCGGSCGSCAPGQTCTAQGQCLCTAESCPTGCCTLGPGSPGLCLPGDTPQNCGSGGQLCFSCPRGQTCEDHGFCACRPDHCSGCCLGGPDGTCQPGTTPRACGTGGRTCTACGSGQACCGGVCCGGTTGTICCDGVCVTGNCCSVGDCGSAGNACTNHTCTCGGGPACSGDNPDCCQRPLGLGFNCTNINSDPNNCGVCRAACDFGLICCNRRCC